MAGIPTAFEATYGSAKPVIGILTKYDALPDFQYEILLGERKPALNYRD